MIKKYSLVFIVFLCSFFYGFGQILTFEFSGLSGNEPSATSNFNDANLNNSTITRGAGLTASNNGERFNATSWATTSIANAMSGNDYMEFTITPNATYSFDVNSIVISLQRSGTGPSGIALRSSLDGYSTNLDTEYSITDNSTTQTFTFNFSHIANVSSVTYRIYMWAESTGGSGGPGDFIGNDIVVNGSVNSSCTDAVDYANIQFPTASPQTITVGDNFDVYAQVYEPTVTEAPGAGAGITAWIGYNTTNNNPNNAGWTWLPTTFNTQSGNNDEFVAEIGSALATGTYYYASRFELNSCGNYIYGGTGGIWSNDSVELVVEPDQVDFCNVDFPKTASINTGDNFNVYAQAYEPGITNVAGAASNIPGVTLEAWIGYNTVGINHQPWNASGWTWVSATYDSDWMNNDQYVAEIGSALPAGTYYYASRFRLNGSEYSYGGIQADNTGNFWDATNNNGTLTISNSPCNELMISEYHEAASENEKYIEVYNPTGGAIDLSNYQLVQYNNASNSPTYTLALSGTLASYGTYVIANNSSTLCPATADLCTTSAVMNFNGNDAIALQTFSGTTIDIVGTVGTAVNFAVDTVLRRISTVQNPNSTYTPAEWSSTSANDTSDLGNHISDCQASTPEIQLVDNTATNQNCGYTIDFGTQALATNTDLTFDIENVGSADLDISSFGITGDYTIVSPAAPFTITPTNSQTVTVRFAPTANGTRIGVLTINNNDSNEGACTVNLTGEGFTPAPEIDIERNTGGSIPTGSAPNNGYNTIFAATTMGSSTAPKTYHVSNEGTANLSLTSIISSNPAEFSISLNPGATIINPSTEVDFEITFSPTGIGLRTATITIVSDDADESSYTFNVQGNGDCAAGNITLLPDNGPVGTIVTVTGSNFGGSTTAKANGTDVITLVVNSSTEIEVTIPSGATTGSLEINDDLGCLSSGLFTIIDELISDCEGSSGLTPTDLFITEVTDKGTGSHSYVEIYNGTGAAISLNTYDLRIHNNGTTTATTTIPLSGTILNDGIIVIAFGGTNANDPEGGYAADFFSGGGGINEDDHIRLYDNTTWVDLWGDTSGNPFTIATKDYTYRRKNSGITVPSTTWDVNDWDAFTPVDYSNIGIFDFSIGVPPTVASGPTLNYSCNTATISVTGTEGYNAGGDTKELAYQWYYSAPGDTGWTEVPDDAIYNNPTTATLDILDTSTLEKYQYYCQVREDDQDCYEASDAVQLTLPTTTWTSSGWSTSAPDSNTIAIIDYPYNTVTDGNIDACSLIVNASNTLTIGNSYYVNVVNNVLNYGTINIQTQGSFVQQGDGAAAGTFANSGAGIATVNKHTATFDSDISAINYTYWSSPVNDPNNSGFGQDISTVFPTPVGNRKYYFMAQNYIDSFKEDSNDNDNTTGGQDDIDDNANDWTFATGAMEIGRGYAVTTAPPVFTGPYSDISTVFSGALNTGDITVTLYKNNNEINDNNWNFIGNPYPSAISVDDFFSANIADVPLNPTINGESLGAIFLWSQSVAPDAGNNGNENINFAQSDYAIINRGAEISGSSGVTPARFIPSGQGFFVALTEILGSPVNSVTSGDVVFTNSMRRSGNNIQFFEANDGSQDINTTHNPNNTFEKNVLWLNMTSDNGVFSQIAVAYVNGATNEYDGWSYDTPRNLSTGTFASIHSVIESSDSQFAIQGKHPESLTLNEIIPLGFITSINEATLYKFSLAQFEGSFLENNSVHLKDNLLNTAQNLKESDYSFTSEVGEFNNRFEIVFTEDALSAGDVNIDKKSLDIIELQNGDVQFKVSSQFEMKSIEIIDLLGRTLYKLNAKGNAHTFTLSNLSQATYLAKVELTNGYVITKKALKRR